MVFTGKNISQLFLLIRLAEQTDRQCITTVVKTNIFEKCMVDVNPLSCHTLWTTPYFLALTL